MHPKDADGMANSVDPDQTASSEAVWSWSALFAETYLSQYIEFVRYLCSPRLCRSIHLAERLVLPISDQGVTDSSQAGGKILSGHQSGPKVIKLFSCSTQLMKFSLLIIVKMPTAVSILTFYEQEK